jgi:hypothetical protein
MVRMLQWKQFLRAVRARLTRTVRGAKEWWNSFRGKECGYACEHSFV